MKILTFVFLLLMGMTWRCVQSTCVLETDFGLSINCGLKKSGMFRVRNLGGLKGYLGVGIQLADELGFKESLSSLEQNSKRRSVNGFPAPGSFEPLAVPQDNNLAEASTSEAETNNNNQDRSAYAKMTGRTGNGKPATVPPFRPLMSVANTMMRNVRLAAQQQMQIQQQPQKPVLKPLPLPPFAALPESIAKVAVETPSPQLAHSSSGYRQQQPAAAVIAVMTPAIGRPPSPIVQHMPSPSIMSLQQPSQYQQLQQHLQQQQQQQQLMSSLALVSQQQQQQQLLSPAYYQNAIQQAANRRYNAFAQNPQNSLDSQPIVVAPVSDHRKKQPESLPMSNEVDPASVMSLFNVAAANNVSVQQLAMALRHQQKHHMPSMPFYSDITTTVTVPVTTTTPMTPPPTTAAPYFPEEPPVTKNIAIKPYKTKYATGQKVMNAPKEYYPVGYDKNFDDHFTSKVDLPDTSFSCGDQKHFPGLYGDEDLGCMVFHVCAFTDDGLTQKSFLCPESTLFDQTILKCNWWFYVDCKSSRKLYDSNIPITKSYQLMKALTFFSSYSSGPTMDDSVAAVHAAVSSPSQSGTVDLAKSNPVTETPSPRTTDPPKPEFATVYSRFAETPKSEFDVVYSTKTSHTPVYSRPATEFDFSAAYPQPSNSPKYDFSAIYPHRAAAASGGSSSFDITTSPTTSTTTELLDDVSFQK